jgi:sugar phosphate isomerase/epimerase
MMKTLLAGLLCGAALAAQAAPPFFVFDNGLRGEGLGTIAAQLDLAKSAGYAGVSWRSDTPARLAEVRDGAKARGLEVFVVYVNLDLKDGKLVPDAHVKEVIEAFKGTVDDGLAEHDQQAVQATPIRRATTSPWPGCATWLTCAPATGCASRSTRTRTCGATAWRTRCGWCKQVDRPNVGVTFNLCHALYDGAEDRIPALLAELAPHLFCVTINGADSHPPKRDWTHLIKPLGQGSYEVDALLRRLAEVGYRGPVGQQCYSIKQDPRVYLPASVEAWKQLTKQE